MIGQAGALLINFLSLIVGKISSLTESKVKFFLNSSFFLDLKN